jgi:two-component system, OmpR family, sensor histidine kinase BaeS
MRSLAGKLTLAFLLVGVTGVLLFALLVGQRTRSELDRFLSARDQAILMEALGEYYSTHGSWLGVRDALGRNPPMGYYIRNVVLVDQAGRVVLGSRGYQEGEVAPAAELAQSSAIRVNGQPVGYVLGLPGGQDAGVAGRSLPPEADFFARVGRAAVTSAVITILMALLLGSFLARTFTRPMRELTAASRAMANGALHQQVSVKSHDEIGELALAFNQMSTDLARASQLRRQMTADLAHDLRTPLSILSGYIEGLKEGKVQGSLPVYAILQDEVEQMQRLVDDLRLLSLADAGELSLKQRVVDPTALLERTGLAYMVPVEEQQLGLRIEAAGDLPSILVDTDRMSQVLNNLVSNALRHTVHGEIVLSAWAAGQQVFLQVRDTGLGIDPADLPFVFDRFYRTDKARQRSDSNSSGLGLAITKAIVEAHGGSIRVESRPGQGASFIIALPAVRMAEQSA